MNFLLTRAKNSGFGPFHPIFFILQLNPIHIYEVDFILVPNERYHCFKDLKVLSNSIEHFEAAPLTGNVYIHLKIALMSRSLSDCKSLTLDVTISVFSIGQEKSTVSLRETTKIIPFFRGEVVWGSLIPQNGRSVVYGAVLPPSLTVF